MFHSYRWDAPLSRPFRSAPAFVSFGNAFVFGWNNNLQMKRKHGAIEILQTRKHVTFPRRDDLGVLICAKTHNGIERTPPFCTTDGP